jgi:23S rRNA (adenine2030-N6)-methyltransferase
MFSYRHGFHAGNHADVLKHTVLVAVLAHLLQKDKPFWVIDTHAGGGLYDLTSGYATKSGESGSGIAALWPLRHDPSVPSVVRDFLDQVALVNDKSDLHWYPGSPQIAAQMLREGDHLRLYELHPTEIELLQAHFASVKRGVSVQGADGFVGLKGCLPPPTRRGLVHIDPPYEVKDDYRRVLQTLREALTKFPSGAYAIWYPEVARMESQQFPGQLKRLMAEFPQLDWLHATLRVKAAARDGLGLYGSGMFVINQPFTLYDRLEQALPWLVETIGQDTHAAYTLEAQQS